MGKKYIYWTTSAPPGIACMYGKDDEVFGNDYIVGGVSGHVDHAGKFFPEYKNKQLPTCTSLREAKIAVELAHGYVREEPK